MFRQAYWRAQVALVGGDGGVEGWRDERGWFVRGDNERLGPRPALEFGFSFLVQPWIGFLILGRSQFKENFILVAIKLMGIVELHPQVSYFTLKRLKKSLTITNSKDTKYNWMLKKKSEQH